MVAFNFKAQFADAVERGVKRQTIRAIRKDGRVPHIGSALQLYTGMRTKNCRKLKDAVCTNVWPITIASKSITINRQRWTGSICTMFALNDGFEGFAEMRKWFDDVHGLPFSGHLIKW